MTIRKIAAGPFLFLALQWVAAGPLLARTWIVDQSGGGDFTRVTDACAAAAAGDTVAIRPGDYDESVGEQCEVTLLGKAVHLIGLGGDPAAVRLRLAVCYGNCDPVLIQGLTFHDETCPLVASLTPMTVRNCVFADNIASPYLIAGAISSTHELRVEDSLFLRNRATEGGGAIRHDGRTLTLRRCVFIENETDGNGGAVYSQGGQPSLDAEGCLFMDNVAYNGAALTSYLNPRISGCTFYRNRTTWVEGAAIEVSLAHGPTVERCIVAGTINGYGIGCWEGLTYHCFCFWQNERGDAAGYCGSDCSFDADPLFCDPDAGDFHISGDSPCANGDGAEGCLCGLIGAYGPACGATPVESMSWGRIKARYGTQLTR
jgi:predicted outer membrane repeat protein